MKKVLFLATCGIIVIAMSGTVFAGETKPAVYLGGGLGLPMSPSTFSDFWKMGFGGTGRFAFEVSPAVEVGATIGYSSFSFDDDKFIEWVEANFGPVDPTATVDGLGLTALEFLADVKYMFSTGQEAKPFVPYLVATAGMTNLSFDDATVTEAGETTVIDMSDVSATDLTLGFGAGFQYMLSPKTGLWFDGKYMIIMTEGESTSYVPIRAGIKIMFGGN
ncbi:MAG: outer membrane beta-barrel protein [Candidatus Zixiibacteriota bacterium]